MRLIEFFLMIKKKLITIVMELWIIMDNEDLVDSDEDFRVDLMLETQVIFFLHSLVEDLVVNLDEDLENELMYEKILRCDFVSLQKILFWEVLEKLNLIVQQLAIIVVVRVEKQKPVKPVMDMDKFVNVYKLCLVLWNKHVRVVLVVENEKRLQKNVPIVMQVVKYVKKSRKRLIFQRVSKTV